MRLEGVCETFDALSFPPLGVDAHPDRERVARARSTVADALSNDEFLVDCIGRELEVVERSQRRPGLLPFYVIPDLGIRFSFGYWPPGAIPGAHEHTAWTITAVCRNELDIVTFDRSESYRRRTLVQKRRFRANAGQVGFIYEPAIHAPQNSSREWTLSFHVTSPRDGDRIGCDEPLLPPITDSVVKTPAEHPYVVVLKAREREAKLRLLTTVLLSRQPASSTHALARCYRLASTNTRRAIRRARPEAFHDASEPRVLSLVDDRLELVLRREGDTSIVEVMTAFGDAKVITINEAAHEAFAYALANRSFDVRALPGGLSAVECDAVGDVLEETGLFQRIES